MACMAAFQTKQQNLEKRGRVKASMIELEHIYARVPACWALKRIEFGENTIWFECHFENVVRACYESYRPSIIISCILQNISESESDLDGFHGTFQISRQIWRRVGEPSAQ